VRQADASPLLARAVRLVTHHNGAAYCRHTARALAHNSVLYLDASLYTAFTTLQCLPTEVS
jgi:hypothetical protein